MVGLVSAFGSHSFSGLMLSVFVLAVGQGRWKIVHYVVPAVVLSVTVEVSHALAIYRYRGKAPFIRLHGVARERDWDL